MFCSNCGHKVEEGQAFCANCGNKLVPIAAEMPNPTTPVTTETKIETPMINPASTVAKSRFVKAPDLGPAVPPKTENVAEETPVQPIIEQPVAEETPVQPVIEQPVAEETPVQPVVEQPVVEEAPVQTVIEQPVVEEAPVQPVIEQPVVENTPVQPVIEQPVVENTPVQPAFSQNSRVNMQFANTQIPQQKSNVQIPHVMPIAEGEVKKKKKGKKGLIIGGIAVIAAVIIAAIVGLILFLLNNGGEEAQPVFYVKDDTRMMIVAGKTKPIEITKAETEVYATSDGKHIVYGINYDKDEGTYTLVYASVNKPDDYTEIDDEVKVFRMFPDVNALMYVKADCLYISTSLKEGEKIWDYDKDDRYVIGITQDFGKILYKVDDDDYTLYIRDISEDEDEKIADNVYKCDCRYTDDGNCIDLSEIYYITKDKTLYKWEDGDTTEIADDVDDVNVTNKRVFYAVEDYNDYDVYMIDDNGDSELIIDDADYGSLYYQRAIKGTDHHVFTSEGDVIIFDEFEANDVEISEDGKYLYAVNGKDVLYSYKIEDGELTDKTKLCDDVYSINELSDGVIGVSCNNNNSGFAYGSEYYEFDGDYETKDGKIYYVSDGDLYIATLGEKPEKADCEDDVKYIYVTGEHVYYIADWNDKKEKGNLYLLGKDKVIDEGVSYFGSYVEEDEEDEEEETTEELD